MENIPNEGPPVNDPKAAPPSPSKPFDVNAPDDLAAIWEAHRAGLTAEPCSSQEAVRLDERRGVLATWCNAHLGPRAGLTPGRTLLIGGAAGAGKTSLGALVAVDAMAAGCPVMCWQLELGREEMLEHLVAQYLPPDAELQHMQSMPGWKIEQHRNQWWRTPFHGKADGMQARAQRPLPKEWGDLLHIPDLGTGDGDACGETIIKYMGDFAELCKTRRAHTGAAKHEVNGLVLVDYLQLLTMASRAAKDAGHEVLTTACSRMAKTASQQGMVLVLLSQRTKEDQKENGSGLTGFHGADVARMAHVAMVLNRADADGKPTRDDPQWLDTHGERRLITIPKTRGTYGPRKDNQLGAWVMHRALHNADNNGLGTNAATVGGKDKAANTRTVVPVTDKDVGG